MANHENFSSDSATPDSSVDLWQEALAEEAENPTEVGDSLEAWRKALDENSEMEESSLKTWREALDENEAAEPGTREGDLAGLEKIEHRFARLRKFGDKLLSIFTKREIKDKSERREAQRQLAGKIGSAALETAKKTAAFAIETATKAAVQTVLGG